MAMPDRSGCRRYQRLRGHDSDEEEERPAIRRCVRTSSWRSLRRRAVPVLFRMSRRRASGIKMKVRLMRLLLLQVPARFAELVRRVTECPAIVFSSSQWGLPVLSSHLTSGGRTAQLRAFYLERSISYSGAGGSLY